MYTSTTIGKTCTSFILTCKDIFTFSSIQQSLLGTHSKETAHTYQETYVRYS